MPRPSAEVGCSAWKLTAKKRKVTRKLIRSSKRVRARLDKTAARDTYKRVFCALALKRFQTDICKVSFNKIVTKSDRARRLEEADWLIAHELSSASSASIDSLEANIQENTFDVQLIADLKAADTTSFSGTTVEDKGIVTEVQTIEIFEDDGSVPESASLTTQQKQDAQSTQVVNNNPTDAKTSRKKTSHADPTAQASSSPKKTTTSEAECIMCPQVMPECDSGCQNCKISAQTCDKCKSAVCMDGRTTTTEIILGGASTQSCIDFLTLLSLVIHCALYF